MAADVRDAAAVVGAMHELVARIAVPRLFAEDVEAMRAANERFAAAVGSGDVDGALRADDELHDVLVRNERLGNWETAVPYHLAHAVVLLVVSRIEPLPRVAWWLIAGGIVIFSGTIASADAVRQLSALGVAGYVNEYTAVQHIVPALAPHLFPDNHNRRSSPRVVLGVSVSYRCAW